MPRLGRLGWPRRSRPTALCWSTVSDHGPRSKCGLASQHVGPNRLGLCFKSGLLAPRLVASVRAEALAALEGFILPATTQAPPHPHAHAHTHTPIITIAHAQTQTPRMHRHRPRHRPPTVAVAFSTGIAAVGLDYPPPPITRTRTHTHLPLPHANA